MKPESADLVTVYLLSHIVKGLSVLSKLVVWAWFGQNLVHLTHSVTGVGSSDLIYHMSSYSFRGNYSFLNLTLCTVTFGNITYRCGNYSREKTIQGRKLYEEIRYALAVMITFRNLLWVKVLGFYFQNWLFGPNFASIMPNLVRAGIMSAVL